MLYWCKTYFGNVILYPTFFLKSLVQLVLFCFLGILKKLDGVAPLKAIWLWNSSHWRTGRRFEYQSRCMKSISKKGGIARRVAKGCRLHTGVCQTPGWWGCHTQGTTVLLPCLVMLQRVSRSYKGHQISEKFDTNEEVKWNLLKNTLYKIHTNN